MKKNNITAPKIMKKGMYNCLSNITKVFTVIPICIASGYIESMAVSIQHPNKQDNINIIGNMLKGKELNFSPNPYILDDLF